ncbi:UNVERIFIED_ORG: hypothetical protein GGD58_001521 [Rhizobium pisi]
MSNVVLRHQTVGLPTDNGTNREHTRLSQDFRVQHTIFPNRKDLILLRLAKAFDENDGGAKEFPRENQMRPESLKFAIAVLAIAFAAYAWRDIGGQAIPLAVLTMVGALYNQTPWNKNEKDIHGK